MKEGPFRNTILPKLILLLLIFPGPVQSGHLVKPVISIIIDDMGYRGTHDINVLKLPGPITYAIMPHAPYSRKISEIANESGNNVILHLPMEAMEDEKNRFLGPGGLKVEMSENQFISTLSNNLQSIPNVIGVNNHMGSLLTKHTEQMEWLMGYLQVHRIFYLDSLTSSGTVASVVARQKHVPYLQRDVFLDNNRDPESIEKQFRELIRVARRKGTAIAIGHPHPETIEVLNNNLVKLNELGVSLISIKDMLDARHLTGKKDNFTLSLTAGP